jgi:hypothetical protein
MRFDSTSSSIAGACEPVLQPYQAPRLTVFGSVTRLTETGSISGMEDNNQNGRCMGRVNTTFNMC